MTELAVIQNDRAIETARGFQEIVKAFIHNPLTFQNHPGPLIRGGLSHLLSGYRIKE